MNWRRGILLAAINLAVAVPLIVSLEMRDATAMRERKQPTPSSTATETAPAGPNQALGPKNEVVSFNPCWMTYELSPREKLVVFANLPVIALTDWRAPCPARWTLAGVLKAGDWTSGPSFLAKRREVDVGLLFLIALQWFLLGAFPIKGPRKWREPGMFITICSAIAAVLLFIPQIQGLAGLPALFILLAWFWWLGLLVWKLARSTWKRAARNSRTRSPSN
ncbi:MAG: hypothetical protein ABSG84_13345 [Acidobacteriaceae bacterium]|jgi:hypothetical protein